MSNDISNDPYASACGSDYRVCAACHVPKPSSEYHRHRYGLRSRCKDCCLEHGPGWWKGSEDGARRRYLNITSSKLRIDTNCLDTWLRSRPLVCEICGRHEAECANRLCIDHNHETGELRGLLCVNCNTGIGQLRDSRELVARALAYLDKYMGDD